MGPANALHPSAQLTRQLLIVTLSKSEIDAGNAPSAEPTSSQSSGDVGRGDGFYAHEEASGEGVDVREVPRDVRVRRSVPSEVAGHEAVANFMRCPLPPRCCGSSPLELLAARVTSPPPAHPKPFFTRRR